VAQKDVAFGLWPNIEPQAGHYTEFGHRPNTTPQIRNLFVLKITHQTGPHRTILFETKEDPRGKWTDFKFQIRFSTNENGRIKAWLGDKRVVDYDGVKAYPEKDLPGYARR
jgi:hypothetical protein